ncbi:anti-sigma B factor antagonist [Hamadaea flava]|uniref:Anti-sigma factor antagonist n=1 Tax=Hamadaea flava TaxID=1742688 RepID=A0ABV8LQX7_9ACTN|nr:STAS domain-containing protein [Hamadaea flava]MCP2322636.1 anti-sigma B factor antagonist [Hamadaea flava]
MSVRIVKRPDLGVTVVEIAGELDIDSAPAFRECLTRVVRDGGARIVVDARGLWFCDSIGLSSLITTQQACTARGGFLRLAGADEALLRLLLIVGLLDYVTAYASVEAAASGDPAARAYAEHARAAL